MDAAADVHHQLDVVLHQHHGHALGRHLAQHRAERGRLLLVLPAGRLVEQQHLRVGGQRPGQLDDAGPGRWAAGRPAVGRGRRCRAARAARRRPASGSAGAARVGGQPDVLATVSSPKGSRRWNVRARPRRARLNGASLVTSWPSMRDPAAARRLEPADHVEQGRLAGTVRSDQAGDLAGLGREVDTSSRASRPPKRDADAADLERAHPATHRLLGIGREPERARRARAPRRR